MIASNRPVAQWLEPSAHNGLVGGSSPSRSTNFKENKMYTPYTDMLSAEAFIKILAAESLGLPEASARYEELVKAARSWVSSNLRSPSY